MRPRLVLVTLAGLLAASAAMMLARPRPDHPMPASAGRGSSVTAADLALSASDAGAGAADGATGDAASAPATTPDAGASDAGGAGAEALLDRPLRVLALGWDLAAPGVLANGGLAAVAPAAGGPAAGDAGAAERSRSAFTEAGLPVELGVTDAMASVEAALARGGADKDGADVALVPLPSFVASCERLRALSPAVFFVVGWSRGREALVSAKDALPAGLPAGASPAPGDKTEVKVAGTAGDPASFLALFALDLSGTPAGAVRFVSPASSPTEAPLAAIDREGGAPADPGRRKVLLTTADASRLVPYVAIAQAGLVEQHGKALAAWGRAWLDGTRRLDRDPAGSARLIAASPGAPDPLALLRRLGETAPASLADEVALFGLSGRGALTVEVLFQRSWQLWRAAGLLATPAPDSAPVASGVVAAVARSSPELGFSGGKPKPPGKAPDAAAVAAAKALVVVRQADGKLDEAALLQSTGLLAEVFERSALRVAVMRAGLVDGPGTKRLVDGATERFDVTPGRVVAGKSAPAKVSGVVEVLAVP